jgi:endonuclease-3 related protein
VVDTYTRRIFERHQLATSANDYETIRLLVESALREGTADENDSQPAVSGDRPNIHQPSAISMAYRSELAQRYNEFHALLVQVGKHFCLKKAPNCTNCPLSRLLPVSDNAQTRA